MADISKSDYDRLREEQLPWIEKYRPRRLESIILTDNLKKKATQFIKSKDMFNLLLSGPPGIGKTTTIRCIAHGLYGKYYNKFVLELNASDHRGIKSVQGDIINFCKCKTFYNKECENLCNLKLIILDEADNMMEKAQHQINSLMEKYKETVRFAFTCNSSTGILEAIQSRCIPLRYMRLTIPQITDRLSAICNIEKAKYDKTAMKEIAVYSRGDMRGAINMLQLIYNKYGTIKSEYLKDVYDLPQPVILKQAFTSCINKDLPTAVKLALRLKNEGYSGSDITLGMLYTMKSEICDDIPARVQTKMLEKICYSAYCISKGIDSNLQLISCIVDLVALDKLYDGVVLKVE
jgi:replication factor C subunit 2/4